MQSSRLDENVRVLINNRVRNTLQQLKIESLKLEESPGIPANRVLRNAVMIEALQFVIRSRDPQEDSPEKYAKGHQLLSEADFRLESVYENPRTLDDNLQGESLTTSIQYYMKTLIRACIADIDGEFTAILKHVENELGYDISDEVTKSQIPQVRPPNLETEQQKIERFRKEFEDRERRRYYNSSPDNNNIGYRFFNIPSPQDAEIERVRKQVEDEMRKKYVDVPVPRPIYSCCGQEICQCYRDRPARADNKCSIS